MYLRGLFLIKNMKTIGINPIKYSRNGLINITVGMINLQTVLKRS